MPYIPPPDNPDDIFSLHGKALNLRILPLIGYTPTAERNSDIWRNPSGSLAKIPDIVHSIDRWKATVWPVLESSGWDVSITHSSTFGWYVSVSGSHGSFTGTSDNLALILAQISVCALERFRKGASND